MKKHITFLFTLLAILLFNSACERVIDIDLNDTDPRLVVEGRLQTDSACTVLLSMTSSYFDSSSSPKVNDATITLSDDLGNSESLTFISDGAYQGATLVGAAGRTYTLDIVAGGSTYQAIEAIPFPVPIDSMSVGIEEFFGYTFELITAHLTDPEGIDNYYEFHYLSEDFTEGGTGRIFNDELTDGEPMETRFTDFEGENDTLVAELYSLSENSYIYLETLEGASNTGDINSAAPYNPSSNFRNGALGYFKVWSVSRDTFIRD